MKIRAGFVIHNPLTNSKTVVLKTEVETQGRGWLLEVECVPNNLPDIAEHLHTTWTETFEIISGEANYKIDGIQKTARTGDVFVVNPRQTHIHPWAVGNSKMVYRQSNVFAQPNPEAVQDVLGVFASTAGLAREGKVHPDGKPKNPLQLAVSLATLVRHGGYDASLPIPVQNFVVATLGRLAFAMRYRAVYPEYLSNQPPNS